MAKRKIIWTKKANLERLEILKYWANRNLSKRYSIKLNKLIIETLQILSIYPDIGRKTDVENIRVKLVRDYLIFYEFTDDELIILAIWDNRRDLKNLSLY